MKVTITVPDELFQRAERLSRDLKVSRSRLYADALTGHLARLAQDAVTEQMNRALAQVGMQHDPFVEEAALRTLRRVKW